jgi:predicted metal-dependent hydrolase
MQELDTDSPYKPNLSNEIDIIAKEWKGNNERIISFLEKVHSKKYISVRYEDLIEQSQRVLRDICHFLGLKYNSQMLNYYKRNQADEIEPKETLDWKKKTLRKPDKRNVGKYKDILEEEDIRVFNDIAGRTLKRFNYSS